MAHEELKRELQSIDPVAYTQAISRVAERQLALQKTDTTVASFREQYPAFIAGLDAVKNAADTLNLDEDGRHQFMSGYFLGVISLKEHVDTAALNDIPTAE